MLRILFVMLLLQAQLSCRDRDKEKIEIVFGGDVMLDRGIRKEIARNGLTYLTEDISKVFHAADFSIVNLECPVTNIHAPLTKKFVFRAEPAWLKSLKEAGVTHCILANNHSYDQGREGLTSTAANLVKNDLMFVGYGETQQRACMPVMLEKNGIKVALFSSVTLPLESWMYLEERAGMCQASNEDLVIAIKQFRQQTPQTKIIVTLHWGVEYQSSPTPLQQTQALQLIEAGADAIVGHHPHVVQSYENINGKPVFYSIGNLIFDNPNPKTREGMLVKLSFGEDNKVEVIPYQSVQGIPTLLDETEKQKFLQRLQKISDILP